MMNALRVYKLSECDARGVPLDWDRCRLCAGTGAGRTAVEIPTLPLDADHAKIAEAVKAWEHRVIRSADCGPDEVCGRCGGFGSLKVAALVVTAFPESSGRRYDPAEHGLVPISLTPDQCATLVVRCEDCGHPMSDGTWEDRGSLTVERAMEYVVLALREGHPNPTAAGIHYSRCDEGCRHELERGRDLVDIDHGGEASWREVDVRCLSWPHDLRPEMLAVLCLRCYADRINNEMMERDVDTRRP